MKKAEITKIVVKMGEREQTLTIDQARELQAALNALFGRPAREYVPYPVYPKPYWPWNEPSIKWAGSGIQPYKITCGSLGSNLSYNSGTVELKLSNAK